MLLFLGALAAAHAEESTMTYDLLLAGKDVGDRTVTVRHIARDDGERRVLSVLTTVDTPAGAAKCRQSGQSSARGANFTTSLQVGEVVTEVQGIQAPSGSWQLVVADAAGVHDATLKASQVHFTSLDLFDPGRTRLLVDAGPVGLLLAETGALLEGELSAGEPTTVKVAGKALPGTRYTLTTPEGAAEFVVDAEGVLLRSRLTFLGGTFETVARTAPVPRNFGTIDVVESPGAGTREADL